MERVQKIPNAKTLSPTVVCRNLQGFMTTSRKTEMPSTQLTWKVSQNVSQVCRLAVGGRRKLANGDR